MQRALGLAAVTGACEGAGAFAGVGGLGADALVVKQKAQEMAKRCGEHADSHTREHEPPKPPADLEAVVADLAGGQCGQGLQGLTIPGRKRRAEGKAAAKGKAKKASAPEPAAPAPGAPAPSLPAATPSSEPSAQADGLQVWFDTDAPWAPQVQPKLGCKSYTIHSETGATMEVHVKMFYLKKTVVPLAENVSPSINFSKHGGKAAAWEHACRISGWNLAKAGA